MTVVATGQSVEFEIEAAEPGSVSLPIAVVARLKKIGKTYESKQVRLRASEGRVRIEGMSIANPEIRIRKIASRIIDIPQDSRPMDVLSLRLIFTHAEIEESELGAKVLDEEARLGNALDWSARSLADYGVTRNDLRALAEARIRENVPSLRKALFESD